MKASACFLGLVAVLGLTACESDPGVTLAPTPPIAFVRYVNIVPDTSGMDWRPIDAVENSPFALNLTFRANTAYQAMGAGARKLRIFPTSENINVTSQIVQDTTINFTANTYYTVVHYGYSRSGQTPADRLWVIEDQRPASIGANQIALRVINGGIGLGNLDVQTAGSTTGTFGALFSNIAPGSASAYQLVATGDRALRAVGAGGSTVVAAAAAAPIGSPAANGQSAIGGTSLGGSMLTALVVPSSVAGSRATAFAAPSVIYIIDKGPA